MDEAAAGKPKNDWDSRWGGSRPGGLSIGGMSLAPAVTDLGLLAFYTVVAFAGAFVRFIRYDVR